jgi:predicted RNase H-like nuclease (RuvC/YqgF family)
MPRSPAPERVNKAFTDRIQHLKDENSDLKDDVTSLEGERDEMQRRIAKEARIYRAVKVENEQMRKDLATVMARLTNVEEEVASLRGRVERTEKRPKG